MNGREVVVPNRLRLLPSASSCCGQEDRVIPCFRCGVCCSKYQVRLNLAEARRIADVLGVDWQELRDKYLDCRWPGTQSFLLRQESGACVFLRRESDERKTSCLIHPFRPSSCREWTPDLFRRECQAGLSKLWGLKVNASGQIEGSAEKFQDFYSFLDSLE